MDRDEYSWDVLADSLSFFAPGVSNPLSAGGTVTAIWYQCMTDSGSKTRCGRTVRRSAVSIPLITPASYTANIGGISEYLP